jgi:large subunit ribosomal protein L14
MIQAGTVLKITDKTSIVLVTCIKVFGNAKKRIARLGDVVLVSVKRINVKKSQNLKLRLRKRYSKGTLHRALIIRTKINYCRVPGIFIRFNENSGVIVNKRVVPMSNRVFGPVLKELCTK